MDPVKEIDSLKAHKNEYEKKLSILSDRKIDIERQIIDTKSKITSIDQAIFQRENFVYLEAAKMAAASNPEFEKLVKAYAEKIIFESVAKKPKGRPKKDAS